MMSVLEDDAYEQEIQMISIVHIATSKSKFDLKYC